MNARQMRIFEIVQKKGEATVAHLATTLFVSQMTIRRDLVELEKNGMLTRYHGGAVAIDSNVVPINLRMKMGENEKKVLAKIANKHLKDDMYVYIDSSSTCMYIIPYLQKYKNITVVTNSVRAVLLASKYHIPCFLAGGEYREQEMCMMGSTTNRFLQDFSTDIAFLTSLGFSDDGVISEVSMEHNEIRKTVMSRAKKTIFLFGSSKLHKSFPFTLCTEKDADEVICL